MTAPTLSQKKFYIIKPATGRNYLYKPTFAEPDGTKWWSVIGTSATLSSTAEEQRHGAYCMQVDIGSETWSAAKYAGISVTDGLYYTFSADVKADAGHTIALTIRNAADTAVATKSATATGYWQRLEVSWLATETSSSYNVRVTHSNFSSDVTPMYVDGVQFEPTSVATTLMEGYMAGCRWEGIANDSTTYRTGESGLGGGEIVDLEDYCKVVSVTGLGHGDWNQILTKMTAGGDMYQTHIRKSRQFSIIVDFLGNSLGEIEANRKAVIDLIRPDLLPGQERIVRYQGVDVNGNEATHPVDIKCVPLPASLVDTPDLPSYQRAVLNFSVPSGLLDGAYNEGAELDLYANFPAEFIVKRDPQGKWCTWDGTNGTSLITGLNGTVHCMAEGPDGKIYVGGDFTNAGGVAEADYLARWNPISGAWEAIGIDYTGANVSGINAMTFDANGDLYITGSFQNLGGQFGDYIVKITDLDTASPTISALGEGADNGANSIVVGPYGDVFVGGVFNAVRNIGGSVNNTTKIAVWRGTYWDSLDMGLYDTVRTMAIGGDGNLYIGGDFLNADGTNGDYLCYFDLHKGAFNPSGSFHAVTTTELNGIVRSIAFDESNRMYIGGNFTNAGGNANADYVAKRQHEGWTALETGTNGIVTRLFSDNNKLYVAGAFTSAGGLTLTDRVAVWSNGAWQPLDIDLPGTASVYSILPASDGSLYIGGSFSTTTASENAETGIVALNLEVSSASANTYPFMQVHGPGTLKSITNYSTDKSVMFDGLTLLAGEYINLWFDPLNLRFTGGWSGRGNLMRYVVPGSDYGDFYLRPGSNALSLFMTGTNSNSHAWITWTPLFWGLDGAVLE
jgi:hypothetical protein